MIIGYRKATLEDTEGVYNIVQETIKTIYPKYYPTEVVDFFCKLHCKENIKKDIEERRVGILKVDETIVGTGCYADNHITRVYVLPEFQGQGYGSYIMSELEKEIFSNHNYCELDASLPACIFYEKRGFKTVKHVKYDIGDGNFMVYEIMKKAIL